MGDIAHASQEVEITDQATGYRVKPNLDGSVPSWDKASSPLGVSGPTFGMLTAGVDESGNLAAARMGTVCGTPMPQTIAFPALAYITNTGHMFSWAGTVTGGAKDVETPVLWLENPIASGHNLIMCAVGFYVYAAAKASLKLYANPTGVTYTTTLTSSVINRYLGHVDTTASQLRGGTITYTTIGNAGSLMGIGPDSSSLFRDFDGSIIIPPGSSLLVVARANAAAALCDLNLVWGEIAI